MKKVQLTQFRMSEVTRIGLSILFASVLATGTGCTRVSQKKVVSLDVAISGSSSVEAQTPETHTQWGPIRTSLREAAEEKVIVLNHSIVASRGYLGDQARNFDTLSEKADFMRKVKIEPPKPIQPPVASAAVVPAVKKPGPALPLEESHPFQVKHPVHALPDVMPTISEAEIVPIPDPLNREAAGVEVAALDRKAEQFPAASQTLPSALSQASLNPKKTQKVSARETIAAETSRARLAGPEEKSATEVYKFSFTREVWLLVLILGGVFATLWFRLEYDFGSRSKKYRRIR